MRYDFLIERARGEQSGGARVVNINTIIKHADIHTNVGSFVVTKI